MLSTKSYFPVTNTKPTKPSLQPLPKQFKVDTCDAAEAMVATSSGLFFQPNIHLCWRINSSSPSSGRRTTPDPGLLFNQKVQYLSTNLQINVRNALNVNPDLRSTPLSTIQTTVRTLSSMGFKRPEISRILGMNPVLLNAEPDLYIYPVVEFLLNEALIPYPHITRSIFRCPRLLVSSVPDLLRPSLEYLKSLGFSAPNTINSHTTDLLVCHKDYTLKRKVDFLLSLGLELSEVKYMLLRSPSIFTYSIEKTLEPKVRYLLDEIGADLSELRMFPQYFSFSLEGKIKWRHRMLVEHGIRKPLSEMLMFSDAEFYALLVEWKLQMYSCSARRTK